MKNLWLFVALGFLFYGCGSPQQDQGQQSQAPISRRKIVTPSKIQDSKKLVAEGISHLQEAEIEEAIKSFDDAIRKNPLDPEPYIILGQTYIRLKLFDRAVDTFSAASRIAPARGDIHYLLAISYGLKGQENLAKQSARRSIELFRQDNDEENFLKALALLQGLLKSD